MFGVDNYPFHIPLYCWAWRLAAISLSAVSLLVVFINLASQAQAEVIINEVFPNPNPNAIYPPSISQAIQNLTADEDVVELTLINQEEPANLNGWSLWDQESEPKIIHEFSEAILEPNQYLVIFCGNKLNNSGDTVTLKNKAGITQDQFTYENSHAGLSFSRISNENNFHLTYPTLEESNSIFPTPTPSITEAEADDSTQDISAAPTPTPSAEPTKNSSPKSPQIPESVFESPASSWSTDKPNESDILSEKTAAASAAAKRKQLKLLSKIEAATLELQQLQSKPYKFSAHPQKKTGTEEPSFFVEHSSPFAIIAVIISGTCLLTSSLLIKNFA